MSAPGFLPLRQLVLVDLLGLMLAVRPGERAVIAIDGPDGVGKSHLARELEALAPHVAGRAVHAVSVDGFHHPREHRHARGSTGTTCYEDSYDYDALRRAVLWPFRDGQDIVPAVFDVARDTPVFPEPVPLAADAVLLVEGVFLRRPELRGEWDATCLVTAPAGVSVPRGNARFPRLAGLDDPGHEGNARYVEAQQIYRLQSRTWAPDWIVDNTDLQRPELVWPDPDEPQWFDQ
ncbi:Uridine kinase [Serinicoccus hydrothermalis]|uniref:Uridine kinase n=1 Tax=Serinicoccus hydrothermalis TaxID=1758689 RepID=A0A1B1NH05_9MICO|nr:uridine kinase [Serinicoccus hydrothermalis]ANS80702.1 Uridine kinase [Serinicoccus hydrothermalis]